MSMSHEIRGNRNARATKTRDINDVQSVERLSNGSRLSLQFAVATPRVIMNFLFVCFCLVVFPAEILCGGDENVHFKIHVPDVIKRHLHTKTIFIHVRKATPKKKKLSKPLHKEEHHEWSSWSSYDHHHANQDNGKHEDSYDYKNPRQSYHQRDSYLPQSLPDDHQDEQGLIGYSYPPQYAYQNIRELHHNDVAPQSYEEGYRKGSHLETGHVLAEELNKYHDDVQEDEFDELEKDRTEESVGRTHAGRYFVEDTNYDKENERYEERRASKRLHKRH